MSIGFPLAPVVANVQKLWNSEQRAKSTAVNKATHWYRYSTGTVQYSTVQYSTVRYSTVQYSTLQYSTVRYSTVQYSTVKYSTVQYSTTD